MDLIQKKQLWQNRKRLQFDYSGDELTAIRQV